jgi:hypothetical protein
MSEAAPRLVRRTHPTTGRPVTAVQFRGWSVQVDGTTVSMPAHHALTAGHSVHDLATCLAAARALAAGQARAGGVRPVRAAVAAVPVPRPRESGQCGGGLGGRCCDLARRP